VKEFKLNPLDVVLHNKGTLHLQTDDNLKKNTDLNRKFPFFKQLYQATLSMGKGMNAKK
jgi:hypothetical protein